jgi:putative membrane protein
MATAAIPQPGDGKPTPTHHQYEVRPTSDSHFSWLRTRMSAERTLMSWVRTAIALIGFGFTIYQFLDRFNRMPGVEPADILERHGSLGWLLSGPALLL